MLRCPAVKSFGVSLNCAFMRRPVLRCLAVENPGLFESCFTQRASPKVVLLWGLRALQNAKAHKHTLRSFESSPKRQGTEARDLMFVVPMWQASTKVLWPWAGYVCGRPQQKCFGHGLATHCFWGWRPIRPKVMGREVSQVDDVRTAGSDGASESYMYVSQAAACMNASQAP